MQVLCAQRTLCERLELSTQVIAGGGGPRTDTLAALPEHPEGIKLGCRLKVPFRTPLERREVLTCWGGRISLRPLALGHFAVQLPATGYALACSFTSDLLG